MAAHVPDAQQGTGRSGIPPELEAYFGIAERWRLSTDEQIVLLGSPGRSTFFKWKKEGGTLPVDTRERLSHLLGIWKSLRILFTVDERGEEWIRRPNRFFDGASALDVMLEGSVSSIYRVRRYLDAQRGG
ncbi:MbcA/ParS/Xre antitoxin family protein [Methylobacterium sp. E-005]|uniref:antitoxin Xre/MbcA/ParS toxin-binding domain-containing protein n=1 Tax=Methylobacterium sp. E-005 TaxID=2836549 RepID=UPI001FB8A164|nr:antitoxin Xre/MbcA/ParS toxin-binding domain-containing protein [Methylobacterium sp. E-005]MCJ2086729.1 MbcA/ParS/Xre antitoxin family protein [Methylobacterium sp. E-005]